MNRWDDYNELYHASYNSQFTSELNKRKTNDDGSVSYSADDAYKMLAEIRQIYSSFVKELTSVVDKYNFNFQSYVGNTSGFFKSGGAFSYGTIDKNALKSDISNACWKQFETFNKLTKENIAKNKQQTDARQREAYLRAKTRRW